MNTIDLFLKAVQYHLSKGATQASIAQRLGVQPQQINAFMKGRANFSEDRKEQISGFFGMTYLEMLNLGYRLTTGSDPVCPETSITPKEIMANLELLDQDSLKIIDALVDKLAKNKE